MHMQSYVNKMANYKHSTSVRFGSIPVLLGFWAMFVINKHRVVLCKRKSILLSNRECAAVLFISCQIFLRADNLI